MISRNLLFRPWRRRFRRIERAPRRLETISEVQKTQKRKTKLGCTIKIWNILARPRRRIEARHVARTNSHTSARQVVSLLDS